ncbi:glutaredoxin [Stigmatella sp. ncwal1]|uniref:Glutaredoxin n=1 Tax=Stigmatella ashevillensis TaxID=2995309 RepID=A0ABT5DI76_9BACT|nr:glutaredoxin [Stigmatella ashevillena]MDC0712473.1 glutaredoxin [Stigmatella ashevillena]
MTRLTLSQDKVAPAVQELVGQFHRSVVETVASTVAREHVVVVGMATNTFVKRARKLLDEEKVKFTYLEYGGYFSMWQKRLALKLWAGFPTFPMVFIDGTLVGGFTELKALKEKGQLR